MTLVDFKNWLKTVVDCPQWYIGKIDGSKEFCIGLYNVQGPPPNIALGGLDNTSYGIKAVSILVHWGRNPDIAEQKAKEVYNCLFGKPANIGDKRVIQFEIKYSDPISVGTDTNNIYEYVIETIVNYEREVI